MEPFRLDRQAKVFLAVLIALALALIPLAPFAALAFGALSLVVLCVVFLIALARNRRVLGPLTRTEGALALSAGVFAIAGALVIAYATIMMGAGNARMLSHMMLPLYFRDDASPPVGTRGTSYSDPEMQQELKDQLAKAGIPFTVSEQDGKEFVNWSRDHDAAVEAIRQKVHAGPLHRGNIHFGDAATQKEFADWLARKGIKAEVVTMRGQEYLTWTEDTGDTRTLMEEFMADRAKKCKEKTARLPGTQNCS